MIGFSLIFPGLRKLTVLSALVVANVAAFAGTAALSDSVELRFPCGASRFDVNFGENKPGIDSMVSRMAALRTDSSFTIDRITLVGAASPEGGAGYNQKLSARRASAVFNYIRGFVNIPDSIFGFTTTGRDWQGLRLLVEADEAVPARAEVLTLLDEIVASGDIRPDGYDKLADLRAIGGGEAYRYLFARYFPELRRTLLTIEYSPADDGRLLSVIRPLTDGLGLGNRQPMISLNPATPPAIVSPLSPFTEREAKPFYMALKTNMLLDALAIPNLGAEFYLGKDWSVGGNWYYGWWKTDPRHRYWRLYGGDVAMRRWFGAAASHKPLTGHHLGVYAQMLIYDFEFGGKGQMAGKPGCNLWERANYGAGIEYGYSLPIRRRLNIDFTIGIGYLGGDYYEYRPEDGCYVWLKTVKRHWFGPTKAEISLVWLLGRGNTNKKGGKR